MTNLTAAAQAVLDAYNSSPLLDDHVLDHRHCLAAALRAAGDTLSHPISAHTLYAIADELEGVKYGTYRCNLEDKPLGPEWQPCVKLPITVHVRKQRPGETHSSTREGLTPLLPDDLIMRGVQGEEYPIGRELFEQTYRLGAQ